MRTCPGMLPLQEMLLRAVQAVEKALKAVDGKVRPVDPKEAVKGRLDYAQVKDWGSGNADEADALQARPLAITLLMLRLAEGSPAWGQAQALHAAAQCQAPSAYVFPCCTTRVLISPGQQPDKG